LAGGVGRRCMGDGWSRGGWGRLKWDALDVGR
jgi:hypothetical protein